MQPRENDNAVIRVRLPLALKRAVLAGMEKERRTMQSIVVVALEAYAKRRGYFKDAAADAANAGD